MNSNEFQKLCLSLPGAAEDHKWENDLCFCVAGKMFAVLGIGNNPVSLSFKTTPELFEVLTSRDGIDPAPYVARYKWVRLDHLGAMEPAELEHHVRESYRLIFSKLPKKSRVAIEAKG